MLGALLLFQSGLAAVGQLFNIGSSAALFLGATGLFVALGLDVFLARNPHITEVKHKSKENGANGIEKVTGKWVLDGPTQPDVSLWTYAIAMLIPLTTGMQLLSATLVVFVPLVWFHTLMGFCRVDSSTIDRPHWQRRTCRICYSIHCHCDWSIHALVQYSVRTPIWPGCSSACVGHCDTGSRRGHGVFL